MLAILCCLCACETFHGLRSADENFPKLSDPSCVDAAVKATSDAEFISSREIIDDNLKVGWTNKTVYQKHHIVDYRVTGISRLQNATSIDVVESTTHDLKEHFNYTKYYNEFGNTNGPTYSLEQLAKAREVLLAINKNVKRLCALEFFDPTIR